MKVIMLFLRMTYVCTAENDCCNVCATWNTTIRSVIWGESFEASCLCDLV